LSFILLVDTIVAEILLPGVLTAANRVEERSGQDLHTFVAGAFGAALTAVRQGAGKRRDDIMRGSGVVLVCIRIRDLQDVARIL
jgi:hypothetical protein